MTARASEELELLASRLELLHAARHPLGLNRPQARLLLEDARASGDLAGALRRTPSARPVAAALELGKVGDPVRCVSELLPFLAEEHALRRSLRTALNWPLVSAVVLLGCSVVLAEVAPALSVLGGEGAPEGPSASALRFVAAPLLAVLLLLGIALARRLRLPGLSGAGDLLDVARALEGASVLHRCGARLQDAIAAAGALTPSLQEAADTVAQKLTAGASLPETRLLDSTRAALLDGAARSGVSAPVLEALATEARLRAQRWVPDEALRLQTAALLVAGAALLVMGAVFFSTYGHALLRGGA